MDEKNSAADDARRFHMIGGHPVPASNSAPGTVGLGEAIRRSGWQRHTLVALHAVMVELAPGGLTDAAAVQSIMYGWMTDPVMVVLRREQFGQLKNDGDLAAFLVECHARKLNPWAGEAYPIVRWDFRQERNRVFVGVTINTMRCIAHATNQYVGLDAPIHEHSVDPRIPDFTTLSAYKLVDGVKHKFSVTVYWADYYPGPGTDTLWDSKPHVCLDTVCESALLRRMFPEPLSDVYTSIEFSRRDPPPNGEGGRRREDQPTPEDGPVDRRPPADDAPENLAELHRRMADLGVKSLPDRAQLINDTRRTQPGLEQANPRRFYLRVLDATRFKLGREPDAMSG